MLYHFHSSDLWPEYHKITFDGANKLIYVNYGVFDIDVKNDIYSSWKEWIALRDYSKFPPVIRTIGGDPIDITAGIYAGDLYFLMNGWRIVISHSVAINGVLYTEEGESPYIVQAGGGIVATVSNLVQTVVKDVAAVNTPSQIAASVRTEITPELSHVMSLANPNIPSAADTAEAVRTELAPELLKITNQTDGLTAGQMTMLTELYRIMGLDPTKPLIVTNTARTAGPEIQQTVDTTQNQTTVTRV